jgi:hypothetical protein
MVEPKKDIGCIEETVTYPEGHEYCVDVYCFKCIGGEWEMNPSIGSSMDPSEIW